MPVLREMSNVPRKFIFVFVYLLAWTCVFPSLARAEWWDASFPYRRQMEVPWDAEHLGDDNEIAILEFYTGGHQLPNGEDIRIVTADGKLCPTKILKMGPDDFVRVVFQLAKLQKNYSVYWGNPQPPPLPQGFNNDVPIKFGLLFEMRGFSSGGADNFNQLEGAWQAGKPDYGATMIDRPFIGFNPLTDSDHTIDRMSGFLFAPIDGEYQFAGACDDRGALYIDGKPLLFIPGCFGDIRFNRKITLTRGRHEFTMYHVNFTGPMIISLGWKRPDSQKVEIVNREYFGTCARAKPGVMETLKKDLTADFSVEPVAECFEHDPSSKDPERGNYSVRYRFTTRVYRDLPSLKTQWDFGDGQHGEGKTVDHVYMLEGVYPIRVTYMLGQTSDAQTNKVWIRRDYSHGDRPPTEDAGEQSKVVAGYDVNAMPVDWLPWATMLHARAADAAATSATATRLATEPTHGEPMFAYEVLLAVTRGTDATLHGPDLVNLWEKVPTKSDLQPRAVKMLSNILLWEMGDFAAADDSLRPFAGRKDPGLSRRRGEAMVLEGKVDAAKQLLISLPVDGDPRQAAAINGAMARSVEFFITEKETEAGEDAWERWQNRYPAEFLEGYGVVLRVKLMVLANHPEAASKVAEAFATYVPHSSYAPQLLDQASKLIAKSDPAKSAALRADLKQRYPEDPLSQ